MMTLKGFGHGDVRLSTRTEKLLKGLFVAGVLVTMLPKLVLAAIRKVGRGLKEVGIYIVIFCVGCVVLASEAIGGLFSKDPDEDWQ